MPSKLPTLVWVPGSWLSTDIYRMTAARLAEYRSVVLDQPTTKMRPGSQDMHEDIDHTRAVVLGELDAGHDVLLMVHSAGGLIAALAAEGLDKPARNAAGHTTGIVGYVGVASILPRAGKTVIDMNMAYWSPQPRPAGRDPPLMTLEQAVQAYKMNEDATVEVNDAHDIFFNDLDPEEGKAWAAKNGVQPVSFLSLKGPEAVIAHDVPSYYITTSRDKALTSFIQDEYSMRTVGGKEENILRLESDHVPHLSHPAELEQLLRQALNGIQS